VDHNSQTVESRKEKLHTRIVRTNLDLMMDDDNEKKRSGGAEEEEEDPSNNDNDNDNDHEPTRRFLSNELPITVSFRPGWNNGTSGNYIGLTEH
jgi:hypothetical protein